jgi:hypothetical protein
MHNFLVKLQGLMSSSNANNVVSTFCNQLSSLSFNGQLHNIGYKNASDIIQ